MSPSSSSAPSAASPDTRTGPRPGEGFDGHWRWVKGYEGTYAVSDLGRVASLRHGRWRHLAGGVGTPYGHRKVQLWANSRREDHWVHRLVLAAFVGAPGPGEVARHVDGDPSNNRLDNLAWGTPSENNGDMVRHGRSTRGARNSHAHLSEDDVRAIRAGLAAGERGRELARRYGVGESTISQIKHGNLWGWLGA